MLVLFDCGVTCVVANQVLEGWEPFLALARGIVLAIFACDLIVENSELLVQEREDITARVALTHPHEIGTRFSNALQSQASYVSLDATMIPATD